MTKQIDKEFIRKTGGEQSKFSLVTEKADGRGKHPNSKANLEPFEKGQSGNPLGRPRKYLKLKKALDRIGKAKKGGWDVLSVSAETYKEEVLERIWYEASNGSVSHIRMLAELGCLDDDE
jgi:hypothetical protein